MSSYRPFRRDGAPASLDFSIEIPHDWRSVELPREDVDFDDATKFAPLAMLMAPYAAILCTVAARPAYASGTLAQWLQFVARENKLELGNIEEQRLGELDGVGAWGMQNDDGTVLRSRIAAIEDGDRLLVVVCMAPNELWNAVAEHFVRMLATFTLTAPRGRKVDLAPPDLPLAANTMAARASTPAAPVPDPAPACGPLAMPAGPGPDDEDQDEPCLATRVALATTMATFEPEHERNVQLRERGAGFVPNVLDHHDQELWATLAPPALGGTLRVPFGWFVLDDGKRTLVFDGDGHTQVNLVRTWREGRTDDEILAGKVEALQQQWPTMRHRRAEVAGQSCLLVRDAVVDGQPIEQAYLLRPAGDGLVLEVRVTSSPATFPRACELAEVLLGHLEFTGDASISGTDRAHRPSSGQP